MDLDRQMRHVDAVGLKLPEDLRLDPGIGKLGFRRAGEAGGEDRRRQKKKRLGEAYGRHEP